MIQIQRGKERGEIHSDTDTEGARGEEKYIVIQIQRGNGRGEIHSDTDTERQGERRNT